MELQHKWILKNCALFIAIMTASLGMGAQFKIPGNAISSAKHYRESGVGNATGRSGSANMTARALLSKDGNAVVELTTGTLDGVATPPGSFSKVQFKPLSVSGDALLVQNFAPLATPAGYYNFQWPSLHRAQQIQLQGNINGIDNNRTDVVTLVETVKLRPDLAVEDLHLPNSAFVNQPTNISANVVEMNGDASSTTTCVLTIDGTDVDTVNNVFVDAGGSVSCAFVYRFSSAGSHTVQVSAANVAPADWDTSNNSASASLTIVMPTTAEHASGYFFSRNGGFPVTSTQTFKTWYLGNLVEDSGVTFGSSGRQQTAEGIFTSTGCVGHTNAALWQFPVTIASTETMDGALVYSFTDAGITGSTQTYATAYPVCNVPTASLVQQVASDYADNHWNYLTASEYYDATAKPVYIEQLLASIRYAGDVTYFSSGYQCFYWNTPSLTCSGPSDYYTWNGASQSIYGTVIPVGSTWVSNFASQDANGKKFSGSVSVPLSSSHYTNTQPTVCYDYGSAYAYSYRNCYSSTVDYVVTTGTTYQ